MYYNEGYQSDIILLSPLGHNSTMFTGCCGVAICDDQKCCPVCGRDVVGADAETDHERRLIRRKNATRSWKTW